ncbi:MAG TPA: tyrosine-protein phosphatase [Acidimicrobiales bacterium]|nr:tyrosine-protein phosphatase [Acidimicrobiales bacterium]
MTTFAERRVPLETCHNFRDLGGYETTDGRRVRWGRLYRADTLHRLTPHDTATLLALGLRTVIDLRAADELEHHGPVRVAEHDIAHHHLPILDAVMGENRPVLLAEGEEMPPIGVFYVRMLDHGRSAVSRALEVLAGPGALPAVFHCTAGKDRTGILAAVVLSLLGVPEDTIVADYALTEEARASREAYLAEHDPEYYATLQAMAPWSRAAVPETMETFLAGLADQHGSAHALAASLGVGDEVTERLRTELLE